MQALTTSESAKQYYENVEARYRNTFFLYERLKLVFHSKETKKMIYDDKINMLYTHYKSKITDGVFGHSAIMEDCWGLEVEVLQKIYRVDMHYHNKLKYNCLDKLYAMMVKDMVQVQKSIIRNTKRR